MATVPTKKQHQPEPSQIFANRNLLYKRFNQLQRLKEHSNQLKDPSAPNPSFELFKNRLAQYLQTEKHKLSENQQRPQPKERRKHNLSSQTNSHKHYTQPHETEQQQQLLKLSWIKYFRQATQTRKTTSPQQQTKGRIHTNSPEIKHLLRNNTQSFSFIQPSHDHYFLNHKKKQSVPVCTINFLDNKQRRHCNNKTVYSNYLQSKLGLTCYQSEEHTAYQTPNLLNLRNKEPRTSINPIQSSEVLIMDKSHSIQLLQAQKSQLLKKSQAKKQKKMKTVKIKINNIQDIDNVLGPWSKNDLLNEKEQPQEEEH